MRIIAGNWRSRRLLRPDTTDTRPLPDRVRESLFNILGERYGSPGGLPALHVADVFAGSGSIGLEALSRGAGHCCFFERGRDALTALRRNIDALQAESNTTVITGDAWQRATMGVEGQPLELVFLDPPYRDSNDSSKTGAVAQYLVRLGENGHPVPLVVLHHEAGVTYETEVCPGWTIEDTRTIGTNALTFFAP